MIKIKNNKFFKFFIYSFSFFALIFIILLLKYFQISYSIDSNTINPNSMFYGLPSVDLLKEYKPKQLSKIISSDNKVLYEFYDFDSNREVVDIQYMSKHLINGLIANEDKNFLKHYGIHIPSIIRSLLKNILTNARAQGGSTVTMQLARNLYDTNFQDLGHEKTLTRKIKEIILAVKIEQVYTKNEILEMYLNSVYFGNIKSRPMWGIQKASKMIFGKDINELELHESSLLIAILPAPNSRIPFRHPKNAVKYRNIVLKNMLDEKFITQADYESACLQPLPEKSFLDKRKFTPYYVQYVEKELKKLNNTNYKNGGLIIHTTIDSRIQEVLQNSFNEVMLSEENGLQKNFNNTILKKEDAYNDRLKNICSCMESDKVNIFNDSLYMDLNRQIYSSSTNLNSETENQLVEDGTASKLSILKKQRNFMRDSLRQACFSDVKNILKNNEIIPSDLRSKLLVQGAAVIFDIKTGSVLGMIGGRQEDEYHDYFNRAILATRQPGSTFKPFVYLSAINSGYSPSTKLINQNVSIKDKVGYWTPENWNNEVGGVYTLRQGLYGSVNLISVRIMNDLEISPLEIQKTAFKFKLSTPINPVPSITLGSSEVKPIELTSAYSAIANSGTYLEPMIINQIMDKDGKLIKSFLPKPEVVESEASSYILLDMMRDIVDEYKFKFYDQDGNGKYSEDDYVYGRGTGHALRTKHNFGFDYKDFDKNGQFSRYNQKEINSSKITMPCAGKTGTTNQQTDAWFVGFTPEISMGVWIGMDDKRIRLGNNSYGSSTALPIFAKTMNGIYNLGDYYLSGNKYELDPFNDSWDYLPEGVSKIKVCKDNNTEICKANKYCRESYSELFLKDFEPIECN
jgi:penicillin-binding protein 1A